MNPVYKKLQAARLELQATAMTKSGRNTFSGYNYFELGDFVPAVQKICGSNGLFGMVSYTHEIASLTIYDTEAEGNVVFTSPMSTAALKGCHEVQNLGAVQSYLRKYLWMTAFEVVEHDALDAVTGSKEFSPQNRSTVANIPVKSEATKIPATIAGTEGGWQITASMAPDGDPQEWLNNISRACSMALEMANTEDDVLQIFKKNKKIFDAVKTHDAIFFKNMMAMFTKARNSFIKE